MAQTGYTPILIYSSSTVSQAPAVGNLTNSTLGSELAINITDGKLFYKDNANAIQVIAWKTTPTTAGGTGLTSYTAGDLLYYATGTTLSKLAIGSAYQALQVNAGGTAPSWQASATSTLTAQGDLLYASAANTLARLAKNTTATRYLSNTGSSNNPAWAQVDLTNGVTGTLPVGNGGTGTATAFTAGSVVFAGASGVFSQNNAKFFWDNTNTRLGIGTASPGRPFTIEAAASAGLNAANPSIRINDTTSGRACVIDYDSNQLLTIWNSDTGVAGADIVFRYGSGSGTEGLRLVNDGNVKLANGNFIPSTAAKGINFTANTPAAGMTSQLLNWYEQGTWTPVIAGETTPGTQTYSIQVGRYTRIGNRVFYNCRIVMTAKDAATSGTLYVGGLPFTSNNTASNFSPAAVSNAGNIDLTAGYTQISAEVQPNGTVVYLGQIGDNVAFSLLTDTALTNTTRIALSGNYEV